MIPLRNETDVSIDVPPIAGLFLKLVCQSFLVVMDVTDFFS
jgi:hypothetical protein